MLRSLKGKEPRRSVPQTLRDQDKEATHPSLVRPFLLRRLPRRGVPPVPLVLEMLALLSNSCRGVDADDRECEEKGRASMTILSRP
jgi:hypothetical protein